MAKKTRSLKPDFYPATPERWADLEALFGPRGACGGCWCMVWRLPRQEWEAGKREKNRRALKTIVETGTEPGVLAYVGGKPAGWCAVAPRADYPGLARSRVLKPIDDTPVWSVSCFFIGKEFRKQGLSVALLRAVVDFVKKRGGAVVEGYPVEPYSESMPAAFAWTGTVAAFRKAGFKEAARGSPKRPIMRYQIGKNRK
jgi:GNAT superfamily N-acetyltransferase